MANDFHEQLSLLCNLQEIDLNLHKFQGLLDQFPERLREVESAYLALKGEIEATKAELADIEKTKRTDEAELEASVDHLRKREAKLYAIKTNKEYQAAIKEISEGKRLNREREDRVLRAMEKIDELDKKSTQLNQGFADKEGAYNKMKEELAAEDAELKKHMEADIARRPEIVSKLKKEIFRKYEFVRRRYTEAMAAVRNGACQGCSRKIAPQMLNEMLRLEEFKVCPSCQRLIYLDMTTSESEEDETGEQ